MAEGNHLWHVGLKGKSFELLVLTTKRDPVLAVKKALSLTKDKKSDAYLAVFDSISYGGVIDA